MNLAEFNRQYSPTHKCYAVYTHPKDKTTERGLILDTPRAGLSGRMYININNLYTELYISEITAMIVTSIRWSDKRENK